MKGKRMDRVRTTDVGEIERRRLLRKELSRFCDVFPDGMKPARELPEDRDARLQRESEVLFGDMDWVPA